VDARYILGCATRCDALPNEEPPTSSGASARPASTPSLRGCGYDDPLLNRWCRALRLRRRGLTCSCLRVGAGELDGALLRHSPPHKAIVGGKNDIAAMSLDEAAMSLDETFEFAGIDPPVDLCRADAAFPRELADRPVHAYSSLSIG